MLKNKFLSFFIFALITYSASFIGSIATITYKEPWYSTLTKASFNPPDWLFAPVWTTLYLFMTIAIWSAWHKNYKDVNLVFYYLIHLCFNTTWSIIFLMMRFKKISNLSFILMIPYLLWCTYAIILNSSLLILN